MDENPTVEKTCQFEGEHIRTDLAQQYANQQVENTKRWLTNDFADWTLETVRELSQDGTLTQDEALAVFNTLADKAGFDKRDRITSEYVVSLTILGNHVGDWTVEADDEDAAIETVRENLSYEATLSVEAEFEGSYENAEIDVASSWHFDLTDYMEFEANEA